MSPDRILYVGAIKFIFQGMLAFTREPVTAPMRRAMWAIAKERASDYCREARIHHAPVQPTREPDHVADCPAIDGFGCRCNY